MSYEISMPYYEGPMELLLDLVSKKKIEIVDISISELADGYMERLEEMKSLDMEITSDFIYMASRLLEIKSRYMLYLSAEEESEDPRAELFDALLEYAKYKETLDFFTERHQRSPSRYFRIAMEIYAEEELDLSGVTLSALCQAFPEKKEESEKTESIRFVRPVIPVEEKIRRMDSLLEEREHFYFDEVLDRPKSDEKVATMLGILELARGKRANLFQTSHLERIRIERGAAYE
ncbi:MAG: segregation/condensation protein A [Peptostreptococcaceae bacterium]|nr:segregation/condensation protein A [Peptostreptococcaceae bacterium]